MLACVATSKLLDIFVIWVVANGLLQMRVEMKLMMSTKYISITVLIYNIQSTVTMNQMLNCKI